MITVTDLSLNYSGTALFSHVDLQFLRGNCYGIIGANGAGKSTFLKILSGELDSTSGEVNILPNTRMSVLKQDQNAYDAYNVMDTVIMGNQRLYDIGKEKEALYAKEEMTDEDGLLACQLEEEYAELGGWEAESDASRILQGLGLGTELHYNDMATLDARLKVKVLLAQALFGNPDLLMMDEPTNNLDIDAVNWLEDFLLDFEGTVIVVSHDRHFLDSCVDHILSINKMDIEVQKGNFSSWYANKEARDRLEEAANRKLGAEVKRLKQAARQSSGWSDQVEKSKKGQRVAGLRPDRGFIGHKAAKMMKRAKVLENRQQQAIEEKSKLLKNIDTKNELEIRYLTYHTDVLAECREVSIFYDEKKACSRISFKIRQGERVCLSGRNGCGKSSILKLLLGEGLVYEGNVHVGSGLKISYVSQDTSYLKGDLKELAREYGLEESLFKTLLCKLDLSREQFEKDVSLYSAGQKKKVLLAKSLCEQAHLYVWDEPLNYIDVFSRMQLEKLLLAYRPTMLFVEHDGRFRENIATKTLQFHGAT